jgi:hypothetical protein
VKRGNIYATESLATDGTRMKQRFKIENAPRRSMAAD